MFRTVPLLVVKSFSLYTQQWYVIQVCWQLASGKSAKPVWHIPIAARTVLNSWWWTKELPKTCRVLFQK